MRAAVAAAGAAGGRLLGADPGAAAHCLCGGAVSGGRVRVRAPDAVLLARSHREGVGFDEHTATLRHVRRPNLESQSLLYVDEDVANERLLPPNLSFSFSLC